MAAIDLIVIAGQTATGKSDLAIELAEKFDGEIICADSRTVYKGMDIGTAKPSDEDRKKIKHHLLDVVGPNEKFNAADFKHLADKAIEDIQSRGKLPILVGGTGLYIDAVIFDFDFRTTADATTREKYNKMPTDELQHLIINRCITMPVNEKNRRHLVRALETGGQEATKKPLHKGTFIIGLSAEKAVLSTRINSRINNMIKAGLVEEVKRLSKKYGWENEAMRAPAYISIRKYLEGEVNLEEAISLFERQDLALAKRQMTWFKRNKSIHWVKNKKEAVALVTTEMNK